MKKKEMNFCELCGTALKQITTVILKDDHVICSECFQKWKRKGDPFLLNKMDISIYAERKAEEEDAIKKEMDEISRKIDAEKKREEERIRSLPEEEIIDDILLTGNRREEIQRNIDNCSEGDEVWIREISFWGDNDEFDVPEEYEGAIHVHTEKEIGRIPARLEEKIKNLDADYNLSGTVKKVGLREDGSLFVVIDITAKKKKGLDSK